MTVHIRRLGDGQTLCFDPGAKHTFVTIDLASMGEENHLCRDCDGVLHRWLKWDFNEVAPPQNS